MALGALQRIAEAVTAGSFASVLIHREAVPLPTSAVERLLDLVTRRLVFDFDDAIYLPQPFMTAPLASWLRSPAKFASVVAAADEVFAGNRTLAERARPFARHVSIIPTTVDTDRIAPRSRAPSSRVVIGWIGSPSTAPYLRSISSALQEVLDRHPRAEVEIVGARIDGLNSDRVRMRAWSLEREVEDLRSFDIGVMPLPDDEWARGKCGYKALQYMSAGVATVSSPVGVATEIVEHERNGLLADGPAQWARALSELVDDAQRRDRLAAAGRQTVLDRYSVKVWAPRFHDALLGREG